MTKSKAWEEAKAKIDDILNRMYDKDALGNPLNENSPELLDPINRIANVQFEFNGFFYRLIPDHVAKRLVLDELENRKNGQRRTN
jgi:hypothetical protein